ncbi:hypothetical protein FGG08_004142 [Glutinoglossum americanum]|uniref:Uncharacterized protein n=1 Tax=Glutinoglossum americanum TaxID=1670608 RepID=A0A9P8I116_9PEZI|nr:hypothetical protein FGG08_004142 [Glutinoglossum americanum]
MATPTEQLFHVKRTLIDFHKDPSGALQTVSILGTYTSLTAAKRFAQTALFTEGYSRDDLTTYKINSGEESWPYGDGVIVHAIAPSGETFNVAVDTKPNAGKFTSEDEGGRVGGELYHVLQTTTFYDQDRSGAKRRAEIEGSYRGREEGVNAARVALLDEDISKEWFVEYDERVGEEEWEWSPDGVVHAVGRNGENYLVEIVQGK